MDEETVARFWSKVDRRDPNDCWPWTGFRESRGYGQCYISASSTRKAHRIAFEISNGPIPPGLLVRHRCDNPPCCNPAHLETGTDADNVRDRVERGRNGCAKGTRNGRAKLTEEQVAFIRDQRGKMLQRELGEMFGIAQAMVSHVQLGKTWRHL